MKPTPATHTDHTKNTEAVRERRSARRRPAAPPARCARFRFAECVVEQFERALVARMVLRRAAEPAQTRHQVVTLSFQIIVALAKSFARGREPLALVVWWSAMRHAGLTLMRKSRQRQSKSIPRRCGLFPRVPSPAPINVTPRLDAASVNHSYKMRSNLGA